MDNLTHSLAGLIMGDAAVAVRSRWGSPASPRYRAAALTTAVFANNAPDLDFLYVGITGGKLGYLLHHRGHTHTLAAVPLLALLGVAIVALGFRLKRPALVRSDVGHLAAIGTAGGVLHVLMDFGNNYGVHPFWPVYDGWFYGDAIFIVDPWLMLIAIGMCVGVSSSRPLRGALLLNALALLALAWAVDVTGVALASALTAFATLWLAALWRASPRRRWLWGGAALAALWALLLGTRQVVRGSVREALARDSSAELLTLASTPAPGNPLCWSLLAVLRTPSEYVVRQARAAAAPWLQPASSCSVMNEGQTAPLTASNLVGGSERLVWGPEFRAPLAELAQLRQESCVARAFLRFARVPFWIRGGPGQLTIGDLRFDRSSAIEFAELSLPHAAPCPRFEPPWLPPLSDLAPVSAR